MRLPPFLLERYFAQHEFNAPHLLCVSDCQTMTAGQLLDLEPGARQAFESLPLGYTESSGGPELRGQIAALYQDIEPSDVLVHVGAQEAIFTFSSACLRPGDEVVVHTPCYQSLFQVAQSAGCAVIPWVARQEDGWALDTDELSRIAGPKTRAIFINSPHNPTGASLDNAAMSRIVEIAARRGCLLFSDEVYRFMEYGPGTVARPVCELYERGVSLGVMSKSFGLAGLRVGWVATRDAAVREAMASAKDYTTICGSGPGEFLAALALRHTAAILDPLRRLTLANLELLKGFMARHADTFAWAEPTGSPIAFPRLLNGVDAAPFCKDVLEHSGALLLPGALYGQAWKSHVRMGFGRRDFPAGLAALDSFLMMAKG